MRKFFTFFASCLVAAGSLQAQTETDAYAVAKAGDPVSAFTVQMTDGTTVNTTDLKGKVVLINFWATWCPYCVVELKRVPEDVMKRFEGTDFVFLAIAREEGLDKVLPFREANGYTFPMGIDPDRSIYDQFAVQSIPRNYVVDRDGKIILAEVGYTVEKFNEMLDLIDRELKK